MEPSITAFTRVLGSFCNHVDSRSRALSESVRRRPLPLDSAAASFLQGLQRRISSAAADLNLLDDMARGTVSFEELIGHCNEVYKVNEKYISNIEERLRSFGYVPEGEPDLENDKDVGVDDSKCRSSSNELEKLSFKFDENSPSIQVPEDDQSFDDSISLQNLGLSDACLATLASEDTSTAIIQISKDDYDALPSYMKSLASCEELEDAVSAINSYLCKKSGAKKSPTLSQTDLETVGLGRKAKSYLLLLLRMKQLVAETIDGLVFYRVRNEGP